MQVFLNQSSRLVACRLLLAAQLFKKFLATLQVTSRQLVVWPDKIPGQIVVFNSHFALLSKSSPAKVMILSTRSRYSAIGIRPAKELTVQSFHLSTHCCFVFLIGLPNMLYVSIVFSSILSPSVNIGTSYIKIKLSQIFFYSSLLVACCLKLVAPGRSHPGLFLTLPRIASKTSGPQFILPGCHPGQGTPADLVQHRRYLADRR